MFDTKDFVPITHTDMKIGVEYSIVQCEDKSGFICQVFDFYTGSLLGRRIGESVDTVLQSARDTMHSRPVSLILN